MARIDAEEVLRLKSSVDLVALVRRHGVELKRSGDDEVGRCPFGSHDDGTPSFRVSATKQLFHCFGCGAAGDVVSWLQKTRGVSFRNAVELLRTYGGDVPAAAGVVQAGKLPPVVTSEQSAEEALAAVAAFYASALAGCPDARKYASGRLISDEALAHFGIGCADRTLGFRLPVGQVKAGRAVRESLQRLGILKENGREFFLGCLTFPITDEAGQLVGMYGRRYSTAQRDAPNHLYLKGPHRGVFNVRGVADVDTVVVCESVVDALTFWCAGVKNVTCAYGVEGVTDALLSVLSRKTTVLVAFDRDDAGDRGAEKLRARLVAAGVMDCRRVNFPLGMDANAHALAHGLESLRPLLNAASWMGEPDAGEPSESAVAAATEPPIGAGAKALIGEAVPEERVGAGGTEVAASAPKEPQNAVRPSPMKPTPPRLDAVPTEVAVPPVTDAPALTLETLNADEHHFHFGDRRYRVRGLRANNTPTSLKVNVSVKCGAGFYVDTFDMMSSRFRGHFVKAVAEELGLGEAVAKADVGSLLERLEALNDARLAEALKPAAPKVPPMAEEDKAEALAFLKDPRLMERIAEDMGKMGLVGERTNKLVCYLASISRLLQKPLAIMIRSTSGAGKSSLMDAVIALTPEEDVVKYSAMTSQALFYMGEKNLKHKLLAVAEEEGAEKASYALKLLQSEGELTMASTGKDTVSGRHETKDYYVEGPVAMLETTTSADPDEEFLNRCMVLTVDESREQTRAIHDAQRAAGTEEGIRRRMAQGQIVKVHKNAQRLLKPLAVLNPFIRELTFPDHQTRTRRDFPKYRALIESVTLLHQHQREQREIVSEVGEVLEAVVVDERDIRMANGLAGEIFGQTLDELQPQTRRLLQLVYQFVEKLSVDEAVARTEIRVTLREIREFTGWGQTQLKLHLARLVDRELLIVHRTGPGLRHEYELCYAGDGTDGSPFVLGLHEVGRGSSGGSRGGVGRVSGGESKPETSRRNGQNSDVESVVGQKTA